MGLVLAFTLALAGCGGDDSSDGGDKKKSSDSKTFSDPEFAITFEYPKSFKRSENPSIAKVTGAAGSTEARAVALDNDNLILVRKLTINLAIDDSNIDSVKSELDTAVTSLGGELESSKKVEVAGLPGYEYNFSLKGPPFEGHRLTALFDGKTQYNLNCQYTTKKAAILKACDLALDTAEQK